MLLLQYLSVSVTLFNKIVNFQSQLGHGAGFPYSSAPGGGRPDYSVTTPQRPHDDPLSLHQALGQAVEEAQGGIADNTGCISDLPLLKSKHRKPANYCTFRKANLN